MLVLSHRTVAKGLAADVVSREHAVSEERFVVLDQSRVLVMRVVEAPVISPEVVVIEVLEVVQLVMDPLGIVAVQPYSKNEDSSCKVWETE